jgi:hypothetical protein
VGLGTAQDYTKEVVGLYAGKGYLTEGGVLAGSEESRCFGGCQLMRRFFNLDLHNIELINL